jgi:hypothetical protein
MSVLYAYVSVNSYNNTHHDIAEELLKLVVNPNRSKICIYLLFAKEFLITQYNFGHVNYYIPFSSCHNTTKRKELFSLKGITFIYVLSSDWWISGSTPKSNV